MIPPPLLSAISVAAAVATGGAFTAQLIEATQSGSLEAHCMAKEIDAWAGTLRGALRNASSGSTAEAQSSVAALASAADVLDALALRSTLLYREFENSASAEGGSLNAELRYRSEIAARARSGGTLFDSSTIANNFDALRTQVAAVSSNVSLLVLGGNAGAMHRTAPASAADLAADAAGSAALVRLNAAAHSAWSSSTSGAVGRFHTAQITARLVRSLAVAVHLAANGTRVVANQRALGGGADAASAALSEALQSADAAVREISSVVSSLRGAQLPVAGTDAAIVLRMIGALVSVVGVGVLVLAALSLVAPLPAGALLWVFSRKPLPKGSVLRGSDDASGGGGSGATLGRALRSLQAVSFICSLCCMTEYLTKKMFLLMNTYFFARDATATHHPQCDVAASPRQSSRSTAALF